MPGCIHHKHWDRKVFGWGYEQTPNAIPDDGLFDITIMKKIRKGEVIRSLKMLYDGSILDHPKIEGYKGRVILIDSDPLIHVEADGESLGHSPIRFEIIPQSILSFTERIPNNLLRPSTHSTETITSFAQKPLFRAFVNLYNGQKIYLYTVNQIINALFN